jgi:RNA polymerase sigma factor (sigma-70 family)
VSSGPTAEFGDWVGPHLAVMRWLASVRAVGVDPEDVVQESLLRAWRKRASFDPSRGSARSWLLAVTADQARRARRQLRGPDPLELWNQSISYLDAPADIDLRRAVAALAPRQREAVVLVYYVDLSIDEAAELMGCATGTLKSTLSDARKRLALLLEAPHE